MEEKIREAAQVAAQATGHSYGMLETAIAAKPEYTERILATENSWQVRELLDELFAEIAADKATVAE